LSLDEVRGRRGGVSTKIWEKKCRTTEKGGLRGSKGRTGRVPREGIISKKKKPTMGAQKPVLAEVD